MLCMQVTSLVQLVDAKGIATNDSTFAAVAGLAEGPAQVSMDVSDSGGGQYLMQYSLYSTGNYQVHLCK